MGQIQPVVPGVIEWSQWSQWSQWNEWSQGTAVPWGRAGQGWVIEMQRMSGTSRWRWVEPHGVRREVAQEGSDE